MYNGQFRIEANDYGSPNVWQGPYPGQTAQNDSTLNLLSPRQHLLRDATPPRLYSPNFSDVSPVREPTIGRNGLNVLPRPFSSGYTYVDQVVPSPLPNFTVGIESVPASSASFAVDNLQRKLMNGLQEVEDAALRADRISKEARDAKHEAAMKVRHIEDKLRIAKDLEERAEIAESRMAQAQTSAAQHRALYREELAAKEAAEARATLAEDLKNAAQNRLQMLERERSSMMLDRSSHDDLKDQIAQLQRRLQDAEAENASLRAARAKERSFLTERIKILEQSNGLGGRRNDPDWRSYSDDDDDPRLASKRHRFPEPPMAPYEENRRNSTRNEPDWRSYSGEDDPRRARRRESFPEPPMAPHEENRGNSRRNDLGWHRHSDEGDSRMMGRRHNFLEPPMAPDEELMSASSPPQGKKGSVHLEAHEALKNRRLAEGIDLILPAKDTSGPETELRLISTKLSTLEFTAELTRCENVSWKEDPHSLKITIFLDPGKETRLGTIKQGRSARFGLHFSWDPKPQPSQARSRSAASSQHDQESLDAEMRDNGIVASQLRSAEAIMSKCKRCRVDKFLDIEFLPNNKALFAKPDNPKNPHVVWKRPREFLKGQVRLFDDRCEPQPSDILQGALGDCWFLASLAAMAEFPDLVKAVFSKSKVNDYGVYELLCYKNGERQSIIIDDNFPCTPETGAPCYSHTKTDEIWVLLLEKGWAKLHGSYERIEAGIPYRALMDLTGNTGTHVSLKDENQDKLWARLLRYDKMGYLMCASTPGEDHLTKTKERPSAGIVPGHAYTLKVVREAEGKRLLNLRNPWGQFEWDGDWSDNSQLWTDKLKRAFNFTKDANDGCFWMDLEDFVSHYEAVDVVYTCSYSGDAWNTSRTRLDLTGDDVNRSCVFFSIEQSSCGYFTLLQNDERIIGTPDYIELGFGVYGPLDSHDGIREVVRSPCWNTREVVEEIAEDHPMAPGRYAVIVFNPSKTHDRSLAILMHLDSHQKQRRNSKDISAEVDSLSASLWDDIALAIATNSADAQSQNLGPLETSGNWMPNGGYALAAKSATGKKSSVEWDFSQCVGLCVAGGRGNSSKVSVQVVPGDFQLVAQLLPIGTTGEKKLGFSISFAS